MSAPSVSVIIPSYNTARFITETLDSVFAQTFTDYEVIVVNDGSPDTPQLEIVLKPYFDRIVYLKQENRGLAGARNTGIRRARGAFLAFLDSDDMWLPEFLAEQVQIFHKNPAVDLVYSDTFQFRKMLGMGTLVVRPLPFDKPLRCRSSRQDFSTNVCAALRTTIFGCGSLSAAQRWRIIRRRSACAAFITRAYLLTKRKCTRRGSA